MRKGKRFAVMLVVIALAAVMAISMSACGGGETDTGGDATPVKLVLDYTKVKTSYDYDEPFTSNGLVVRVEMSDGTRQEVKTGYKVEKPDMTPGQHMVTVTYGELSARYPVFVSDMIKNYDDSEFAVLSAPGLYVVEAEDIDLGKCEASPIDASAATIQRTSSVFVGKKAYLTNFGAAGNLVIGGRHYDTRKGREERKDEGSIIMLLATDIPLNERQLKRLAKRSMVALGRVGSYCGNGSGDIAIAFTTANRLPHYSQKNILETRMFYDENIDPVFESGVEAVEEAIISALYHAETATGVRNNCYLGLRDFVARYGG